MKKRMFLIMISLTLILLPMAACSKNRATAQKTMPGTVIQTGKATMLPTETTEALVSESAAGKSTKASYEMTSENPDAVAEANAKAEQAYMDFLNGKTKVSTDESFREDDADYNYDGLLHGTYSYDELKDAITILEGSELNAFYGLLDCGNDGISQLVLHFESVTSNHMNWVGIINLGKTGLELNFAYEDGDRISSELYTSSYLYIEGALGAGAYHSKLLTFDEAGKASELFTLNTYSQGFAGLVVYDLGAEDRADDLLKRFEDISGNSSLEIRAFREPGLFSVSVDTWSQDAQIKSEEEAIIAELVKLGAKQVSSNEMDKLSSIDSYRTEKVVLKPWGTHSRSNDEQAPPGENTSTKLYVDYLEGIILPSGMSYKEYIGDTSEYQVKLIISCDSPMTNVSIMELLLTDYTQAGEMVFSANEVYSLGTLNPAEPLLLATSFPGDYAFHGLSYTDAEGQSHTRAILISGMDGSVYFADAIFE